MVGEPGSKLTKEERVFFIHWLRWRLREGPLPDKETLFEELEAAVRLLTGSSCHSKISVNSLFR